MEFIKRDVFDDLPAAEPPPGQTSNLKDPWSLNGYDIATGVLCVTLTLTFFLIRVVTKRFLIKLVYLEDYICGLATALFMGDIALVVWAGAIGGGRHQWDTSISKAFQLFYIANCVEITYCVTMLFAKLAILLQIRRVFSGMQHGFVRFITTVLIWCNIGFYIAAGLSFCFACWPREAIWDPFVSGRCINTFGLFLVSSALNLVSDVMILLIPIVSTWRLVLPLRQKIGVCVVFATGGFACVAAVFRLQSSINLNTSSDLTLELMVSGLWSLAEIATVLICGCLPCLPRFLKFFWDGEVGRAYASGSGGTARRGTIEADREMLRDSMATVDIEKAAASRVPDPHPLPPLTPATPGTPRTPGTPIHPALRAAIDTPKRLLLHPLLTRDLDRYQGPALESQRTSILPPHETEDTSTAPPTPPKKDTEPPRKASLSDRATSPQSLVTLKALAGRFWQDAVDDRATGGEETRRQQIERDRPRPVPAHVRNISREMETRRYTLERGALRPVGQ